jgi:hypothetical protein
MLTGWNEITAKRDGDCDCRGEGGDFNRDTTDLMTQQLDDDNDDRQNSKRVFLNVCCTQTQDHVSCHGASGFPTPESCHQCYILILPSPTLHHISN